MIYKLFVKKGCSGCEEIKKELEKRKYKFEVFYIDDNAEGFCELVINSIEMKIDKVRDFRVPHLLEFDEEGKLINSMDYENIIKKMEISSND